MPYTVLVADDDQRFARQLVDGFRSCGVCCLTTDTCTGLLEQLTTKDRAASIVLEPNLPGRSWCSFLLDVRQVAPNAQIVIATAYGSAAMYEAARTLGITAVFRKPVPFDAIHTAALSHEAPLRRHDTPEALHAERLSIFEWEHINTVLWRCGGNVTEAARLLGLPRQTLYRKLRKYPDHPTPDQRPRSS